MKVFGRVFREECKIFSPILIGRQEKRNNKNSKCIGERKTVANCSGESEKDMQSLRKFTN